MQLLVMQLQVVGDNDNTDNLLNDDNEDETIDEQQLEGNFSSVLWRFSFYV